MPGTRGDGAVLFRGGRIATMDAATRAAEVVVVAGGRIVAVGPAAVADQHPDAEVVDLGGRTLAPAFIDAHDHLSIAALQPRWVDASRVADRASLVTAIRAQEAAEPEAAWIRLHGWDEATTGFVPTRADLDAAGIDRPIVVAHSSLHQCVASSAALDELGIGRTTRDPAGGEIGRGADGEPDGRLIERAWSEAHARSLAPYTDPDRWAEHIAAHARTLWADGITAVHDAACSPAAEAVYASMAAAGALPVSVVALPHPAALLTTDLGGRLDGPPTGEGDERLRVGPVKLFADGGVAIALDATIAGHRIQLGITMDDLQDAALSAVDRGFGVAVHAIGNVGVDLALDALERAAARTRSSPLLRVEHATVTRPSHWARMAALGAIAVVQPGFVEHIGHQSGGVGFDDDHWMAFAGLLDAGVTLAGSSDEPCAPRPPLWCAGLGTSRTTSGGIQLQAEQAVELDAWLHAYTAGAAEAGGQAHERGRIAVGLVADLIVLDLDAEAPMVVETWRGGEQVHRAATA